MNIILLKFCRPICPARKSKLENREFFETAKEIR
ncbi:Ada metal-binding domain-containing protein [Coxiella burnetii]|nr:ADA regulatory protein [Coxiella burnetii CbuG_Q212]ARI65627.1 hypothetical protein B7L74_04035 [Coxiella burnetii]OYK84372.1 hypothetical protein CbuRSA315_04045 [Coxiella burnetii]OYK86243.1 hypothetical protein CbuQ229_06120 [Coxiella burnetii]OYK88189.1 hypothetical protein CbuRSA345_04045 [Coxiella burnetii]